MIAPVKLTAMSVATNVSALFAIAFTPSELTAITIAVGALLATIFTGIVNILTVLRAERKIDANTELTAQVNAKTEVIQGSVDGQATAAAGREEALQKEMKLLREMLADKTQTAAVLAQAASSPNDAPTALREDSPMKSLNQIDQNTAAIEKNTARTEADVKDLKSKS